MNDSGSPEAWVEKAEHDLLAAQQMLRRRQPLTDISTFHAQQCAEKCLKGLLVKYGVSPPRTHDLLVLNALCATCGLLIPVEETALIALSRYAVQTRYPGDDPTPEEAKYALAIAQTIRKFARALL